MNRYDRKMVGKAKQKKRFIPYKYKSYAEYESVSRDDEMSEYILHPLLKDIYERRTGAKPYYKKYWRGSSEWYRGGGTMKSLKYQAKRECRNYYRREISLYMGDMNHDVLVQTKFGDIWDFT